MRVATLLWLAITQTALAEVALPHSAESKMPIAQSPEESTDTSSLDYAVEPIFSTGSLIQLVLSLVLIIVVIYALAWYVRKVQQSSFGLSSKQMKVLASLSLGGREKTVLIQVGDQQVLLGVTPQQVNKIAVFDQPVWHEESSASNTSFAELLNKKLLNKKPLNKTMKQDEQ